MTYKKIYSTTAKRVKNLDFNSILLIEIRDILLNLMTPQERH